MRIEREKLDGRIYIYFGESSFLHFINEWKQLIGKYNWYNYTFIELSFEADGIIAGWEMRFVVLGLGVRVRINTGEETEHSVSIKEQVDKIKENFESTGLKVKTTKKFDEQIKEIDKEEHEAKRKSSN